MLFAHLVHDAARDINIEGISIINIAHEAQITRFLQIIDQDIFVRALKEVVDQSKSFLLLHRSNLDSVGEVVCLRLLSVHLLMIYLSLKDLQVKCASCIPQISLDHIIIQLL